MTAPCPTPSDRGGAPARPHRRPTSVGADPMSEISHAAKTLTRSFSDGGVDIAKVLLEGRAFFALIIIVIVFSILSPNYFSISNFLTMANHVAIYGLLSIGMLLVILNGGIDLSVGSALALAGVIAGGADAGRDAVVARASSSIPPVWVGRGPDLRARRLRRRRQRRADRLPQGAGLRRDARHALRRARRRAPDDQRPHLQQPRRQARARQHRLRLARLQPHRAACRSA